MYCQYPLKDVADKPALLFICGGFLFACLPLVRGLFLFVGCGGELSASCLCLASESA